MCSGIDSKALPGSITSSGANGRPPSRCPCLDFGQPPHRKHTHFLFTYTNEWRARRGSAQEVYILLDFFAKLRESEFSTNRKFCQHTHTRTQSNRSFPLSLLFLLSPSLRARRCSAVRCGREGRQGDSKCFSTAWVFKN